uniref:Strictosidine synthase conserved region domain-containing protein n=1 Tax=Globodera rostochiensis TaxID=31243 RepID=A0A914I2A3_GLORO
MGKSIILFAGVVGILSVFLFGRPSNYDPIEYSLPPPPELKGELAANTHLRGAKLLLKGQILGPESLLVEGSDTIYTGTWDAKVVKIVDGAIQKSVQLPPNGRGKRPAKCATFDTEHLCGRPLGIRRLDARQLVVADSYFGLFTVDFDNDKEPTKQIFSPDSKPGGQKPMFINDLDVMDDGTTLFFSDSSNKFDRAHFLHGFLENRPTGRLLQLDLNTGVAEVVLSELHFANGVQIHPDKASVLVAECSMARIQRYYFAGPKKGQHEVFIDNLPGFPDNIRLTNDGTSFLVGLAGVRHADQLLPFVDMLGHYPAIRKFILQVVPERYLFPVMQLISKKYGFVLELGLDGKVLRTYQDPIGSVVSDISQAIDDASHLYLGSFHADFIAVIPKKGLQID